MPIRALLLALSLPAMLWTFAQSAQAANTKQRPTFTLPPPSARYKPLHSVDPCYGQGSYRSMYYRWGGKYDNGEMPCGYIGGRGGAKEMTHESDKGPNKPFEKYAQTNGAPNSDPVMAKYTDEYVQKLEAEAAKAGGKLERAQKASGKTINSRDDVTITKAADLQPMTDGLEKTAEAADQIAAKRRERNRWKADWNDKTPQSYGAPSWGMRVYAGRQAASEGDEYIIVPREE
ncbi:MAG: hypothetical protein L6R28_01515 [Planctomycetes bacterium]|nr:hypothetical protein [Planctomycetota bacterium]